MQREDRDPGAINRAVAEELSLLTVEEVVALLKVKKGWLYDQVQAGKFPFVRVGRRLRFRPDDVRDYLEARYQPVATWPRGHGHMAHRSPRRGHPRRH